jgi:caffeoyl-CoA O-methyltransferase
MIAVLFGTHFLLPKIGLIFLKKLKMSSLSVITSAKNIHLNRTNFWRMKKIAFVAVIALLSSALFSQQRTQEEIDSKVKKFFQNHGGWFNMNVPASDGQLLYNLIVENHYQKALEIGTSTGHSGIWIAWALSKTGGKLITVEIDEARREEALKNFREAGVDHLIDSRLADAHELVPRLQGPFDFVFSDADKGWYRQYFESVDPKLMVGGCYTTHNVSDRPGTRWNRDYLVFLQGLDNYETTVDNSGAGMAISFKKSEK